LKRVQVSRSLAAVALDPAGCPIPGVLIEEFSSDWKELLRSTKANEEGRFSFAPVKKRKIYYLQLRKDGFNPLRIRMKVDTNLGKELKLEMKIAV
jgi:hypothetical protein